MRREKELLPRLLQFATLCRAFHAAAAGKRTQREVRAFEYHLEPNLLAIRRAVHAGTYTWGPYQQFTIRDPKRRLIRAAPFRDRVLHHALVDVLDPLFRRGFIDDTYACIRGRGTHAAVRRYREFARARRGQGYALQCDIERFFASVDHQVLLRLLARRVGDPHVLALLAALIEHGADEPGRGMPIGNLTSQMFANLYLDPLDHFVKQRLRVRHYLRYMDDFLVLVEDRAAGRRCRRQIAAFVEDTLRLRLNARRVILAPLAAPRDVLGYVHHPDGRIRIRRRSVRRLWRRLPALARRVQTSDIEWPAARASVASWFGLTAHADAFRLSRAIFAQRDVRHVGKRLLLQHYGAAHASQHGATVIASRRADCLVWEL